MEICARTCWSRRRSPSVSRTRKVGMRGEMEGREVQDAAEGAVAGGDPRDASGEAGGDAGGRGRRAAE